MDDHDDPLTLQFICSPPPTSTLSKRTNPAFITSALDEFSTYKIKSGRKFGDRLSGVYLKFTPSADPAKILEIRRVHIMTFKSDIGQDGLNGFFALLTEPVFVNYLKAMISIAIIDHLFEYKKFTRADIMSPFELLFAPDFKIAPNSDAISGDFHMDSSIDNKVYQFSLTFVVPEGETIRGTTFVSASPDIITPRQSLSFAIQNGTTVLAKQFSKNDTEILWHSNPISLNEYSSPHSPQPRNFLPPEVLDKSGRIINPDTIIFNELPVTSSFIEPQVKAEISKSVVKTRTFCRIHYYHPNEFDIGKRTNQHTTEAMNKAMNTYFGKEWLDYIINFMESASGNIHRFEHGETEITSALVDIGTKIGVGGFGRNKKCRTKKRRTKKHRTKKRCTKKRNNHRRKL